MILCAFLLGIPKYGRTKVSCIQYAFELEMWLEMFTADIVKIIKKRKTNK